MPYSSFRDLFDQLQNFLDAKHYSDALNLLRNEALSFPEHIHLNRNYQVRVLSQMGDVEGALACFEQSLADGYWFPIQWLADNDSDFDAIVDVPKFKELQFQSMSLQKTASEAAEPELHLYLPTDTNRKVPLIYVLHGNNGTAQESFDQWQSVVEHGWLLATPQSSQLMSPNRYMWNDRAIAEAETRQHIEAIKNQYEIDPDRIVVGGFSRGAGFGLVAAFSGVIPATAFVAVTPVFPELEDALDPYLEVAQLRRMRGYIIAGAKDFFDYRQRVELLSEWLVTHHFPHQYHEFPELGHDYPPNFSDVMVEALNYVFPD